MLTVITSIISWLIAIAFCAGLYLGFYFIFRRTGAKKGSLVFLSLPLSISIAWINSLLAWICFAVVMLNVAAIVSWLAYLAYPNGITMNGD